jgi:site-specific recombinase XerD
MKMQLDRVSFRKRLAPRRDPHYQRVSQGRYVGFRKMTADSTGMWSARHYDGEGYVPQPLGDFATLPEEERWDAALLAALKHWEHVDMGGSAKPHSVKAAGQAYVEKQRTEKGERAAHDAEGFLRRLLYSDPIAKVMLSKLRREQMAGYRARVLEYCGGEHASFNRCITPVRAALNLALNHGWLATDQAWRMALKPFKGAGSRRTLYLNSAKRRELVDKASTEARPLFRTLNLLPMRPGEVAALKVENLKAAQRVLEIPTGKTESRVIPLTDEALEHFRACAKGKLPGAWLVSRADGSQWKKEAWRDEVKVAARKAKLPRATVAYTLRHSVITDLVTGGLDLFTVAKLAGTSVVMIEKHYGHLQREHARSALEKLALA